MQVGRASKSTAWQLGLSLLLCVLPAQTGISPENPWARLHRIAIKAGCSLPRVYESGYQSPLGCSNLVQTPGGGVLVTCSGSEHFSSALRGCSAQGIHKPHPDHIPKNSG